LNKIFILLVLAFLSILPPLLFIFCFCKFGAGLKGQLPTHAFDNNHHTVAQDGYPNIHREFQKENYRGQRNKSEMSGPILSGVR